MVSLAAPKAVSPFIRSMSRFLVLLLVFAALSARVTAELDDDDMDDLDIEEDDGGKPHLPDDAVPVKKPKVEYKTPQPKAQFYESFDERGTFTTRWVQSAAKKDGAEAAIAKYDGVWLVQEAEDGVLVRDSGLVLSSKAKHHAIASKLKTPFEFSGDQFVVQYDVRFTNGQECGGAYIKLLSHEKKLSLSQFTDKTPYTIMFGPDKCGNDDKLHFIFRHKNPVNGFIEEKHAKKPSGSISNIFTDKRSHLLTLVVNSDNTFQIYVDQKMVNSGSLLEDFEPAVNPAKEIIDPSDKKPADWDDREKVADPDAKKPEDWDETAPKKIPDEFAVKPEGWLDDEPDLVPDPEAEKPSDWDDEMDGDWEPPQISNPKCKEAPGCGKWSVPMVDNPNYKGKWKAPMIDNPDYKGKWEPRKIPNPEYFEDNEPWRMTPIGAVGLELWSMSDGIIFDNIIITDDKAVADEVGKMTWALKQKNEGGSSGKSVVDSLLEAAADKPWLWLVYAAVIILPCVGLFQLIRPRKRPIKEKVDEPVADDQKEEEDEEKEEEQAGGDAEKKPSKSSLESNDTEEAENEESKTRKRKPRKD